MNTARKRLIDSGVDKSDILDVSEAIKQEVESVIDSYDVTIDDRDAVIECVQRSIFQHVLRFGEELDITVVEQFDRLQEDFTDESGTTAARSNIMVALGAVSSEDNVPEDVFKLSNAVVAEKYQRLN